MGASLLTNVLALADTLGVKKDHHVDADQLLFLDAVRVMAVVPDVAVVPARGVFEKIVCGIQETKSVRVLVSSFRLLHDLDLRHPHVNLKGTKTGEKKEFVDNKEHVWSPFEETSEKSEYSARKSTTVGTDLYVLLDNIAADLDDEPPAKKKGSSVTTAVPKKKDPYKSLVQYLMLRWLVSLLESDFQVRQHAFQESPEELELIQDSLILQFLMRQGNSKLKGLLITLLRIIARSGGAGDLEGGNLKEDGRRRKTEVSRNGLESHDPGTNATEASGTSSSVSSPGFFVAETDFAQLAANLLTLILELEDFKDISEKKYGALRNAVSIETLVETFMSVLLENGKTYLNPLLQMLRNPHLKFTLILKFIVAHSKGPAKEKLRDVSTAAQLFDRATDLNLYYSTSLYSKELQILLAGAFQVFLETHTSDEMLLRAVCSSFKTAVEFSVKKKKGMQEDMHHQAQCALVIADALLNS
jgi:hypothetical protein